MKRILIISLILASFIPSALRAQAPNDSLVRLLSLDECRQLAVEQNASVKLSKGRVDEAKALSDEAFTKYFPDIQAGWLWYRSNKGALQYTLPTIGEVFPPIDLIDPSIGATSLGEIELLKKGWSIGVTAMQPIFAGGQIVNSNKLAKVGVAVSQLEHESAINNAALTAENYFWQLTKLKADRRTLLSVIQMTDTLQHQVGAAVRAGVVTNNDLLRVDLARNELATSLVDLDNGITLMRQLIAQYLGLDGQDIDIRSEQTPDSVPPFPIDLYINENEALGSTVDYRLLDKQVDAAGLEHRLAVGANMPTVGIGAGYFYDNLLNQNHGFAAVMLSVNVPLTDWWGGAHAIRRSKIKQENAETQRTDLGQMLKLRMSQSWDNLTAAHRKMTIVRQSITSSTENLRINRNFYRAGTVTIADLLEAYTLYRASLDAYTGAYCDFCIARSAYLNATGRQ